MLEENPSTGYVWTLQPPGDFSVTETLETNPMPAGHVGSGRHMYPASAAPRQFSTGIRTRPALGAATSPGHARGQCDDLPSTTVQPLLTPGGSETSLLHQGGY